MSKWNENNIPDLRNKRFLITGGASGPGYGCCKTFMGEVSEQLTGARDEALGG